MSRYAVAFSKTSGAAAGILCDIRTAASKPALVWEVWVSAETAVAGTVALVRSTNAGTTPGGDTVAVAEDYSNTRAAVTHCYTTYGTEPTQAAVYMRRCALAASIGSGCTWSWPNGLLIPTSNDTATANGLLLRQMSALAVTYAIHVVYEE